MTGHTLLARELTEDFDAFPPGWPNSTMVSSNLVKPGAVEALTVPTIAECAEVVIEGLDAPLAAASALRDIHEATIGAMDRPPAHRASRCIQSATGPKDGDQRSALTNAAVPPAGSTPQAVWLDEYAKAVLYNGLGHYKAARLAAKRACQSDDFALLDGALFELVEASARSDHLEEAMEAVARLERRAQVSGSIWTTGVASCARALLNPDGGPEDGYLEAIDLLQRTKADVALGRVRLLYGEWLRRARRRVDARAQLTLAHDLFREVSLSGFAERCRRELLATGDTVRRRSDDTRHELTAWEAQIAQLAAAHRTNPEIGEQLFLSPRTVEWHLRKIFTKLGITSRKELTAILRPAAPR